MMKSTLGSKFVTELYFLAGTILLVALVLSPYFGPNSFHSTGLDQQFFNPPILHGTKLAWSGQGPFLFNYYTGEPVWADPHFSPFYPFYGILGYLFHDLFGIKDYLAVGNYIILTHRFIFSLGAYYLFRTLSKNRMLAMLFAVFLVTSEPARMPAYWVISNSAYAWVPFILGGCLDITMERYFRGTATLTVSVVLSVFAVPSYAGIGIFLIPCSVILLFFIAGFLRRNFLSKEVEQHQNPLKVFLFLAFAAFGLFLMLLPILWAAYVESPNLIRWLRTGPVFGKSALSVGNELFFEERSFDYLRRLVSNYGPRGVLGSHFLGGFVALLFFTSPIVWNIEKRDRPKTWFNIRMLIWILALLHLGFIFGKKLFFPSLLQYVPIVSSIRHLSVFGAMFIILAGVCAFDSLNHLLRLLKNGRLRSNAGLKQLRPLQTFLALAVLILTALILTYSDSKIKFLISLLAIIFLALSVERLRPGKKLRTLIPILTVLVMSLAIIENTQTRFNHPTHNKQYEKTTKKVDQLMVDVPIEGELLNVTFSGKFAKKARVRGSFIQSYLSVMNYRVILSYLAPRNHARYKAGKAVSTGSIEAMKRAGVTLLLTDIHWMKTNKKQLERNNIVEPLKLVEDMVLIRIRRSSTIRKKAVCINHNVCGKSLNNGTEFYIFPFEDLVFRDKTGNKLEHFKSEKSPLVTELRVPSGKIASISFEPNNVKPLFLIALMGLLINIFSLKNLRALSRET